MDATKMTVMASMDAYRRDLHESYERVAEEIFKSPATVRKQFTQERGSCTLNTAYGYAEHFGGRVVFVLDKDWEEFEKVDIYRDRIKELEEELTRAHAEHDAQAKQIEGLIETNAELVRANQEKNESIVRKDRTIEQLSENNNKLINKLSALI